MGRTFFLLWGGGGGGGCNCDSVATKQNVMKDDEFETCVK